MTYYFISLDPGRFKKFQNRVGFLSDGVWIKDQETLSEVLSAPPEDHVFFLYLKSCKDQVTDWAITIRKVWQFAKLVYVTDGLDTHELKEHQEGFAGGDAYIHEAVDEDMLSEIVKSLRPEKQKARTSDSTSELKPRLNKLNQVENTEEHAMANIPKPKPEMEEIFSDLTALKKVLEHPLSKNMDALFKEVLQLGKNKGGLEIPDLHVSPKSSKNHVPAGDTMSDKDHELSLDDLGELEIGAPDEAPAVPADDGFSLDLDEGEDAGVELQLGGDEEPAPSLGAADEGLDLGGMEIEMLPQGEDASAEVDLSGDDEDGDFGDLSLGDEEEEGGELLSFGDDAPEEDTIENLGELDLSGGDAPGEYAGLDLGDGGELGLSDDDGGGLSLGEEEPSGLDLTGNDGDIGLDLDDDLALSSSSGATGDISDDAKMKLMEIDAIMDQDSSQINIVKPFEDDGHELAFSADDGADLNLSSSASLDDSLVSDDLNLDSINFGTEPEVNVTSSPTPKSATVLSAVRDVDDEEEERPIKRKKEAVRESERDLTEDFKEISGAYSGEMERTQATLANLRADRQELLSRIQQLEDDKVVHGRQMLTMRAELDERKIELSIIRKKLNEEINDLKDRLKMQEERKLILEEKNRILMVELDKAGQKNKIDLKKVQMRERELEQKLELLKSDAETQIKNRDLKILELKRKIDAMEFDMESISQQEKRSVESRFELEDKLDKAIKTLRSAITVLEDESDRGSALNALKKNIDV